MRRAVLLGGMLAVCLVSSSCHLVEETFRAASTNNSVLFQQDMTGDISVPVRKLLVFSHTYTHMELVCEGTDTAPATLAVSFDVSLFERPGEDPYTVFYITSMNITVFDAAGWSISPKKELSTQHGYTGGGLIGADQDVYTIVSSYFSCMTSTEAAFVESLHVFADGDVMNVRPDLSN